MPAGYRPIILVGVPTLITRRQPPDAQTGLSCLLIRSARVTREDRATSSGPVCPPIGAVHSALSRREKERLPHRSVHTVWDVA